MNLFSQINQHRYLFLTQISEPQDNALILLLKEARADGPLETIKIGEVELSNFQPIEVTTENSIYEVTFDNYIAYSVRNECYTMMDSDEKSEGRLMCIYSKSKFLDYVKASTCARDDYPGPYQHYGFNCLNHIVDVVSVDPPKIIELSKHQ